MLFKRWYAYHNDTKKFMIHFLKKPIPLAAWSKSWVCRGSLTGIVGSKPAVGMDICLF